VEVIWEMITCSIMQIFLYIRAAAVSYLFFYILSALAPKSCYVIAGVGDELSQVGDFKFKVQTFIMSVPDVSLAIGTSPFDAHRVLFCIAWDGLEMDQQT